jgi:hypothetical protein
MADSRESQIKELQVLDAPCLLLTAPGYLSVSRLTSIYAANVCVCVCMMLLVCAMQQ